MEALKDQDHRDKWPHFNLMNDAMEGRLEGSAPILGISPEDKGYFSPLSKVKKIRTSTKTASPVKVQNGDAEIEVTLNGDGAKEEDDGMEGSTDFNSIHQDEDVEGRTTELEHLALQRERALLDREIAILERDRVLLEREKLLIERETAALKREREMVARDKERLASERRKAAPMGKPEADDGSKDRRERFLQLFEKLIDSM